MIYGRFFGTLCIGCMGGGIECFVLNFVFATGQAGMLGVFELLVCVLEMFQLLSMF